MSVIHPLTVKELALFNSRIEVREDNECWPWLGFYFNNGYGGFCYQRHTVVARRIQAVIYHGEPESASMQVGCTCQNRACMNPQHLVWELPAVTSQRRDKNK